VATVTTTRPQSGNSVNDDLFGELLTISDDLSADPGVNVILLTRSG
jgi:enoyl-CoA hydratase/carnithine racemase